MVGYDNISDNNFRLLVDSISAQLIDKIQESEVCESSHFLNAYGRFQEDEMDSVNYIYDPDNNEDMASLLTGGYTLREIVFESLGAPYLKDDQYCYIIIDEKRRLQRIGWFDVVNCIKIYMKDIVTCAFLYGQVEEYRVLFEKEIEPLIVNL